MHGNSNGGGGGNGNHNSGGATHFSRASKARFPRELDFDGMNNAHLDIKEMSMVCRCDSGIIDLVLLLDTGTVSNLMPEDHRG